MAPSGPVIVTARSARGRVRVELTDAGAFGALFAEAVTVAGPNKTPSSWPPSARLHVVVYGLDGAANWIVNVAKVVVAAKKPPSANCPSIRSPRLLQVKLALSPLIVQLAGVTAVICVVKPPSAVTVGPVGAVPVSFTVKAWLDPIFWIATRYVAVPP